MHIPEWNMSKIWVLCKTLCDRSVKCDVQEKLLKVHVVEIREKYGEGTNNNEKCIYEK